MTDILLGIAVSVLCGANVVLIVMVAVLFRTNERLMRVISTPYRAESDPVAQAQTHYSMYKVNLPEGDS